MSSRKSLQNLLLISISMFFSSSLLLVFLYFVDYNDTGAKFIFAYVISTAFWVLFITAIVIQIVLLAKLKDKIGSIKDVGIIKFFNNIFAIVADVSCIVSLISTVILVVTKNTNIVSFISIAILFFSFEMHCVLNGRKFKYIFYSEKEIDNEKRR